MPYTIDIGPAPANAPCAQLGQTRDFARVNRFEIAAYRIAIIAVHGSPPAGCGLFAKAHQHDFGTYRTLVLEVGDDTDPLCRAYAEAVEPGLGSWLEAAMAPPVEYHGAAASIPRPDLDEITIGALLSARPGPDGHFAIPAFETIHTHLAAAFPALDEVAKARLAGPIT
ncbi:hypothetical protein [uncultured Novosphingobium sp.]|uniref:hypothetical protein n=1 Tax=uncultured Novosphingobium sp. TaxID=292277 RepID=UPI002599CAD0|nr:hypothetical protein [uncultured Novosphingobium sp.]